jgi:hypothetical protein
MKKLVYLLLAFMFISVIPEVANAQSNDPFEQKTLKASGKNGRHEKKVNRKKVDVTATENVQAPNDTEDKEEPATKSSMMTLSNPCEEWLDVEFISLIGSRASQTIKMTLRITNHSTNKDMNIGGNFVAYDNDGVEHSRGWAPERYSTLTDISFKTSFDIPGKINPNTTKVMPAMIFSVGDCRIEMRNVPIDWK